MSQYGALGYAQHGQARYRQILGALLHGHGDRAARRRPDRARPASRPTRAAVDVHRRRPGRRPPLQPGTTYSAVAARRRAGRPALVDRPQARDLPRAAARHRAPAARPVDARRRRRLPRRARAAPGAVRRPERDQRARPRGLRPRRRRRARARRRGRPRRSRPRRSPRARTRSRRTSPAPASTTTPTRARRSTAASRAETADHRRAPSPRPRREVVTYQGKPVITYFFSTSGGRTENVEFGFPGGDAQAVAEVGRGPVRQRLAAPPLGRRGCRCRAQAGASSAALVKGTLQRDPVVQRGVSPRIVSAEIVGSRGRTTISGPTLRAKFGLYDTWAYFTIVGAKAVSRPTRARRPTTRGSRRGARPRRRARRRSSPGSSARPAQDSIVAVQRLVGDVWRDATRVAVDGRGRYRAAVDRTGLYRAVLGDVAGPVVRVR